jgi:hypothetical protein
MMRSVILLFLFLLAAFSIHAQGPKRGTVPLEGVTILAEVEDPFNAQVVSLEAPAPDGNPDKALLREVKAEVARRFPPRAMSTGSFPASAAKTTAAQSPVVMRNFIADSMTGVPPDNDMAISAAGKAISVVNSNIVVLNDTGKMLMRKSLYNFSLAVGLNNSLSNQNNYRYDPKVMYDAAADRYIAVILNGINQYNWIVVGFSQSNDPTGAWAFYKFYGNYAGNNTWFDYPTVGLTDKEFFVSGNKIGFNASWQAGFSESVIYQIDKASGYNADTALRYQLWDSISYAGRRIRNLFPVKGGTSLGGPDQYFLSNRNFDVQNDTIFLVRMPDTIGSAQQTLSITPLVSNLPYGVPPNGRQRSSVYQLATNDGRILGAFAEGNDIQFVSTTNTPGGSAGIYHGRIQNYRTTPVVTASRIAVDTLDFGYPNLSTAARTPGGQQSIINFNVTGPTTFPAMAAVYYDGTQLSNLVMVKRGDSCIEELSDPVQRWGDYTGSQVDPTKPGAVWIEGIYGRKNRTYGSWMARIFSPETFAAGVTEPAPAQVSDATVFPNPSFQYIRVRFTLAKDGVVRFGIIDVAGRAVAQVAEAQCRKGESEIRFNIAALPAGNYVLQGIDEGGARLVSERFVRSAE